MSELQHCIVNGRGVGISVPITPQWKDAPSGVIAMPESWDHVGDGHCVTVYGYDNAQQQLLFVNS